MADITKTVEIVFTGDDNLSGKMDSIRGGFSSLEGAVSSISGPLAEIATSVLAAEAALAALAIGGLALAITEAGKFSDAFSEINTLAGLTGEGMTQFRDDILSFAQDSTQSIEQITLAVYNAISMGVDYSESLDAVAAAEKLAVAGKADLNSSLELLIGTMNAYGAETDEAGRYSDAFFTIVKDGKTTIPELAASFSQVAGIAASAGVDIETLGAALAAVTASGMPTSEAITGIKAALSNIIKPSSDAAKAAQELGVEFSAGALESKGFEVILQELYEATGGNVEQMSRFFGSVEGLNTALVLGADKSGIFAQALEDMGNKTGATQKAFDEMSNNVGLAIQNLVNNMQAVFIDLGMPLLDQFGSAVGALSGVFKGLDLSIDQGSFDPLFELLNEVQVAITNWLNGVAEALPEALAAIDWTKLTDAIRSLSSELGGLFDGLFGDLDLTKSDDLAKFIQKIVDGFAGLTNATAGIIDALGDFAEKTIKPMIDGFNSLDAETQKAIGSVSGWGLIVDNLLGPLGSFFDAIDKIGISLGIIAISSAGSMLSSLGSYAATAGSAFTAFSSILTSTIGSASAGQTLGIMGIGYAAGYAAGYLLDKYVPGVNEASQATADWLAELLGIYDVEKNVTDAVDETTGVLEKMRAKFGEIGEELDDLGSKELIAFKIELEERGMTIEQLNAALAELPAEKRAEIILQLNQGKFDEALGAITTIEEKITEEMPPINLQILADEANLTLDEVKLKLKDIPEEQWMDLLIMTGDYGMTLDAAIAQLKGIPETTETEVKAKVDDKSIADAKSKIDELALKELEIKASIDIANIEAEAKKVEAAFEAMSNLGVAQIEADAQKYVAAIESIGTTITATSDLLGSLFGLWGEADSYDQLQIERWIEEQLDVQREALELQRSLVEEQIKYYQSRREALDSGDAMIKIEADGLEPELEAFMWKILEKVQVRVAEEQADFLLGLNPV